MGSFINIGNHMHIGFKENGLWQEGKYVYSQTGEPLDLDDIFVEGYDYASLIKNAIEGAKKEYKVPKGSHTEVTLDDLMFTLEDTHISFITKADEDNPDSSQLHFNVSYEDIDYKNLRIFD